MKNYSDFLFQFPFNKNLFGKLVPKVLFFSTFYSYKDMLSKPVIENMCKSLVVTSFYPIEKGDKIAYDKYKGVVKDKNFWYISIVGKDSIVYVPTAKIYNSVVEKFF